MGNCQAAEAATVMIENPNGRVERVYWSLSASKVMEDNPGHYVALVISSKTNPDGGGMTVKHLKLLRPDDTLRIGHVYRLVTFEDVLREFATKKNIKISRASVKQAGKNDSGGGKRGCNSEHVCRRETAPLLPGRSPATANGPPPQQLEEDKVVDAIDGLTEANSDTKWISRVVLQRRQWRPVLQSISEVGVSEGHQNTH